MGPPRAGFVVAAILMATAFAQPISSAESMVTIELSEDLRFDPADVTVLVNTTVRWRNAGTTAWHTVTAYEDRIPEGAPYFDSSGRENESAARRAPAEEYLRPGDVFEVTFAVIGDYVYFCVPHEGAEMKGIVHVVERLPDPAASDSTGVLFVGLGLAVAVIAIASYFVVRRRHP